MVILSVSFQFYADKATDASKKDQMYIYIRYCTKDGSLVKHNIDVFQVPSTKADVLLDAILDVLRQLILKPSRIYGQCYDGGSNITGEINVLQQKLREAYSKHEIYVCFYAHDLNLVENGQVGAHHRPVFRQCTGPIGSHRCPGKTPGRFHRRPERKDRHRKSGVDKWRRRR